MPDIRGVYTSAAAWSTEYQFAGYSLTNLSSGSITIDAESGSSFSGTYAIGVANWIVTSNGSSDSGVTAVGPPSGPPTGGPWSGTISAGAVAVSGSLSFNLSTPGDPPHPDITAEAGESCALTSDSGYRGLFDNDVLQAYRDLVYSCQKAGAVDVHIGFSAPRGSVATKAASGTR